MSTDDALMFGPFRLVPSQRLLFRGDRPVPVGGRALDILLALLGRPGELLPKDELIASTWSNLHVSDVSLRVHLAALRKALGDGRNGARYIVNEIGRGYRFVAPVTRAAGGAPPERSRDLPPPMTGMFGFADTVRELTALMARRRFLTIVGPGGIGKTAVAVEIATRLAQDRGQGAVFADLGALAGNGPETGGESDLVLGTLAALLDLPIAAPTLRKDVLGHLRGRTMLIVLDGCEPVIEEVAALSEEILRRAPGIRIIATSREPLRMEGEWVHRLQPLGLPASTEGLTAEAALGFPAIQLFTERAMANDRNFGLTDANLSAVADICRQLDGIPLAIELAAARLDLFGLQGLVARLDDLFALLTRGRRTALPRHRTLRATLDWSHELLPPEERAILRRLSRFQAGFTMEDAVAVASCGTIGPAAVLEGTANLAAKSLLTVGSGGAAGCHRLLNTARLYAAEKLEDSGERPAVARRHALHCLDRLREAERQWGRPPSAERIVTDRGLVKELRAALDWAFGPDGDGALGRALTNRAAGLRLELAEGAGRGGAGGDPAVPAEPGPSAWRAYGTDSFRSRPAARSSRSARRATAGNGLRTRRP